MNSDKDSGFIEIEHTADWAVRVRAPDFSKLLVQSALAMLKISGISLAKGPVVSRQIDLTAGDRESLLVAFLSELLYLQDVENLGFNDFHLKATDCHLEGQIFGSEIVGQSKEIKAVTYHNLQINETPGRIEAAIVFDV